MTIQTCTPADLDDILRLHEAARQLQQQKNMVVWPVFESSLVEKDIEEKRQFKLLLEQQIGCIWTITLNDPEIWGEMDQDDGIYLHRIATNPSFRGHRFIEAIVAWAINYVRLLGREYIRLDTLGNNPGLIQHYTSAGFTYLGITRLTDTINLPEHYHREPDCLRFEMKVHQT